MGILTKLKLYFKPLYLLSLKRRREMETPSNDGLRHPSKVLGKANIVCEVCSKPEVIYAGKGKFSYPVHGLIKSGKSMKKVDSIICSRCLQGQGVKKDEEDSDWVKENQGKSGSKIRKTPSKGRAKKGKKRG